MAMKTDPAHLLDAWLQEDWSGAAYYRAIQPFIPPGLVSADNYAQILAVASQVPGACALGGIYFELELGQAATRADIAFRALPAYGCAAALAASRPGSRLAGPDPWLIMQRLAAKWGQPADPININIAEIWLEFDVRGQNPLAPSFFLTPKQGQDRGTCLELMHQALGPRLVPPAMLATARHCIRSWPEPAGPLQIGFMASRHPAVLRLCFWSRNLKRILNYLKEVQIAADLSHLRKILQRISGYSDGFILHLDIVESLQPRIGIDLNLEQPNPQLEPRWGKLFHELQTLKLCTPAKQEALLQFYGYTSMGDNLLHWPSALRQRFIQSDFTETSFLVQELSHLKVVMGPGPAVIAKAYVSVKTCWNRT